MLKNLFYLILFFAFIQSVFSQRLLTTKKNSAEILNESINRVTDMIVHDIFSPPVSSRIYAYCTIAAYEAIEPESKKYNSLSGKLNEFVIEKEPKSKTICYELASITALFETAKAFIFSEDLIQQHFDSIQQKYFSQLSTEKKQASIAFGKQIAKQVIQWSQSDHYAETRTFDRYTLLKFPGSWEPTPPDYADGIEPNWGKIRTFVLDSASQCKPKPPTQFDTIAQSTFYKEALFVYEKSQHLSEEEKQITFFWDDNPAVTKTVGHLTYIEKKPSPAGHWIGITQIAIEKKNASFIEAAYAYALVSIAIADGFISCWNEKYTSHTMRPETYIHKYIDENWKPFLQTPPFPEYTSGHSVISNAAAFVLTEIFDDAHFSYTDSVSYYYGIMPRSFNSFLEAADEASMSRLYGGIHFMPALKNGQNQGLEIGKVVLHKMKK